MRLLFLIAALICFILGLVAALATTGPIGNPLAWFAGGFIALTLGWILATEYVANMRRV